MGETMEMRGAAADGTGTEGSFREEPVARRDERPDVTGSTAISGVDETWTVRERDAECVAVRGVRDTDRLDPQRPDGYLVGDGLDIQRRRGEPRLVMERVDAAGQTCRRDDPYVALRFELPAQVVAHRHEVDEVIGVQ